MVCGMKMHGPITGAQLQVLEVFEARAEAGEPPPSLRELCEQFGWSSLASAQQHVAALVRKGFLKTAAEGESRGVHLGKPLVVKVPLVESLGRRGKPGPAIQHVAVAPNWGPGDGGFVFNHFDDGLRRHGLRSGDLIFVRTTGPVPDSGFGVVSRAGKPRLVRLDPGGPRPRGVVGVATLMMRPLEDEE
jgi:SOS-response transcriptional repressor LexA